MVNCHDVHDKGHTMLKVGVQLSKLTDSVAFELSRNAQKRQQQLQKNKDLVAASNETRASLNGSERYLTIGSSHNVILQSSFVRVQNNDSRIEPQWLPFIGKHPCWKRFRPSFSNHVCYRMGMVDFAGVS